MKIILPLPCRFLFCILLFFNTSSILSQTIDFGKSYINITKGNGGGTTEPGDTLEIRSSIVVRSGTYDSCGYYDAIPAGTAYIPNSIKVITNEGKVYKAFTDALNDDEGWRSGAVIRINLGFNPAAAPATAFRRGRIVNTHKPSFYLSTCIMVASFKVVVTAVIGTTIQLGGGSMTYKNGVNPIQTFNFPANALKIYQNFGICANKVGANSLGTESNGTFGSGKPRNRAASLNVPPGYSYQFFTTNTPNDYMYGIANNTSARTNYTTLNTWPKPDPALPTHRVFSVWDIIGDHTGAISPTLGNAAADTVANSNAGYMLVINAAYRIDSAFQHTVTGLCPNTYYEISCWMRNICSKCGCDSNGKGASNSGGPIFYIPTGVGDSSGVSPNITFDLDGIDYFTTGNLLYNGQWVKKGFTFLTGASQTSFILKFFNNAPGGGGNDWALDDISVSTCSPNMKYSPSINPIVCAGNSITIYDTVRSFFNNYTFYKWQRSTNGGASWTDETIPGVPAVPFWNGTAWEYVTAYTIPPTQTNLSDSADMYRLVAATTLGNLSNVNCSFTDAANIITLNVIDCGEVLDVKLVSFSGIKTNNNINLKWKTIGKDEIYFFDIEKKLDNRGFYLAGTMKGYGSDSSSTNTYIWADPDELNTKVHYRLKLYDATGKIKYSKIIQLSPGTESFEIISVVNPFSSELKVDVAVTKQGTINAELIDPFGKLVKNRIFETATGINSLKIENTSSLQPGVYILRLQMNGEIIFRKVLKQ